MAKLLPRKDVVIMGLGWTGSILAQELTEAGLDVLAIERGPWRDTATDFNIGYMPDELRYAIRKELFLQPAQEAMTMRNDVTPDGAADARLWLLPAGRGRGRRGRALERLCLALSFPPTSQLKTHLTQRYGAKKFERLAVAGLGRQLRRDRALLSTSSNISAARRARRAFSRARCSRGGNPFEGSRSREYPNPPLKMPYSPSLFAEAAKNLGLHPFPAPAANLSRPYVNPLGIAMGECTYCGYCERFGCANYSKSTPQTTHSAGADEEAEFRGPHRMRGDEDQSSSRRQDRQKRHLCGHARAMNMSSRATSSCFAAMG